jgi:N-acetylmuramoyl-L-alanine amidase
MVRTTSENSILNYDLGRVRLGGPIRAEYPPGVVLETSGKIGKNYRIRLSSVEEGYIHESYIEELAPESVRPEYYITSMYCSPSDSGDVLSIPYQEPVPYAVYPEPDQNRIVIALFGVKTSSTWITHRNGLKVIEKITWHQTTPETYTIYVNLKNPQIWGYDIKPVGSSLRFRIKYPPDLDSLEGEPLTGLKIAIEAGHGGDNYGAVGLSGLKEKDINLDLSLKLEKICRENGAEVLQIRDRDRYMLLSTKRDTSRYSDSDIHISIHANSGGGRGGYLGVSGTSTYYHNPFWAPLAKNIYDRLLELELNEFGVIGSFNYRVIRMTEMPSILVEQAFLSHAEDEEKLADDNFREDIAQKIYDGIIDYLKFMREKN